MVEDDEVIPTEQPQPAPDEPIEPVKSTYENLREMVADGDSDGVTGLLDPMPFSDALREILNLSPEERDQVLSMIPVELAAEMIEEAPNEVAVELVERLTAAKAAEIIDELDSNIQADVIGEMADTEAEAILAEMDAEDAADVRRLTEYDRYHGKAVAGRGFDSAGQPARPVQRI